MVRNVMRALDQICSAHIFLAQRCHGFLKCEVVLEIHRVEYRF